mgnify:CR=1 FL=1
MVKAKCVFCGIEQEDYKGMYLIKNDGTIIYFSSSKCVKNHLKLKRDKRKVGWTEAFRLQRTRRLDKGKEEKAKINKAIKEDKKKKVEKKQEEE